MEKLFVLYDADCAFCRRMRDLVIRYDKENIFDFISITSNQSLSLAKKHGKNIDPEDPESFAVCDEQGDLWFEKSCAALEITKRCSGLLYLSSFILFITPRFIADKVYSVVARNRTCSPLNKVCK